ncbi:MAG TPA: 3-dehydroquinate synthase [Candidatus Methylomirabilis sp.]|nr:3-dehydroquinate synthase [Candidatus Methylomirabilis sp.]
MKDIKRNIILSGFMATGKTSVGAELARLLRYEFLDLDSLIEAEAGMSISQIFSTQGEEAFRAMEARMVERVTTRTGCVVATGGGAIVNPRNLEALRRCGVIVSLTAAPEAVLSRIGPGEDRPMLRGGDRRERIRELMERRASAYAQADVIVDTSSRTVEQVAECILMALHLERADSRERAAPGVGPVSRSETIRVNLGRQGYDIHVGPDLLGQAGAMIQPLGLGRRLALVTHPALAENYGYAPALAESLREAGHEISVVTVPPGEESKSLDQAAGLCRELVRARLDRGSAILALGGGVIGDLAGFVAATLFRGIGFVNLPTTLLAQVDSSVGGKTGVNLPEGKNLVGAFHQPRLVLADVLTLRTLPDREFRSGLAEVVKHAMIADGELFRRLEESADPILARDPAVLQGIVARNCAIKAKVVESDEREAGVRKILNFGHTVGHALESALGYGTITHGEAVAHGMLVAVSLSVQRGLCPESDAARLGALLRRFGLLGVALPSPESLETYMLSDKKARDGVLQFVLTHGIGSATLAPIFDPSELRMGLRAIEA